MFKIIFWLSFSLIVYTYLVYPLIIIVINFFSAKLKAGKSDYYPMISVVISAYNEEKVIESRIKNCLTLDYPHDRLEIIIGSDGSEDRTDEIVKKYRDQGVILYRVEPRGGKVNVLNSIVPQAKGEILVFSDANTIFENVALRKLVSHFFYPEIGCVCGKLKLQKAQNSRGGEVEGIYWKYESFLKQIEGEMGVLLGANGGIYAIRKTLYTQFPSDTIVEDFVIPLAILQKGYKVIFEQEAVAYEDASKSIEEEIVRKKRIGAGDYQALMLALPLLNIFIGLPSFVYWSHKVIRWFVPFMMIFCFISTAFLIPDRFYFALFIAQLSFYSLGLLGYVSLNVCKEVRLFTIVYYFLAMNSSLLIGFVKFITKRQKTTWEKVVR